MQPLPPQLELPEGDRFTLPTVSAVREFVPPGGQLPAQMVLMMICGKELIHHECRKRASGQSVQLARHPKRLPLAPLGQLLPPSQVDPH
jgi:hypothetical protein